MSSLDPHVLATDLDGTLIPLAGNEENRRDLHVLSQRLAAGQVTLLFVTGRHFRSVTEAMKTFALPRPDWILCDVGTSIYQRTGGDRFELVIDYQQHLQKIVTDLPVERLRQHLAEFPGLRVQEEEKQGKFKLSFYAQADQLASLTSAIQAKLDELSAPYSIVSSVDPFTGDGLVDLLPAAASKAHALHWWTEFTGQALESIVFAGDSGNDLAALNAGFRAIVVGNASREVVEKVRDHHLQAGWQDRFFSAPGTATSGVLEGCQRFRLFE